MRRTVLGALPTNTNTTNLKQTASSSLKQAIPINGASNILNPIILKNENEPLQCVFTSLSSFNTNNCPSTSVTQPIFKKQISSSDFEFEIFQEDLVESKLKQAAIQQQNYQKSKKQDDKLKDSSKSTNLLLKKSSSDLSIDLANKENDKRKKQQQEIYTDKENFNFYQEKTTKKVFFGIDNEYYEDYEQYNEEIVVEENTKHTEEDGENYNDEEDDEDDDENDDDDDDDEDDDENEYSIDNQNDLEEEGISRLNLATIIDSTNDSIKKSTNQLKDATNRQKSSITASVTSKHNLSSSELVNMDSSSSTQNDLSSPMVLDDTIKFQSHLSSQFDEYDEIADSNLNADDDLDDETKRKQTIADRDHLLMNCTEYKDDILTYMREIECEYRAKPNYMKKQTDITSSMRSILVDWLVEVSEEYKLNTETLYLAVNYTDRFLSQMSVLRGKLQLVGTASMYIASKYEEISPPDVSEFVYITDDTYTKKQVLRMEHLLLKVLDFRMSVPTINYFLLHYLRFLKLNNTNNDLYQRIENMARYLAELTLIDGDTFLAYTPSQIATSAIYLALYIFGKQWTKQISDLFGCSFDLNELKMCIIDMHKFLLQANSHPQQAIQEKYKQAKHDYVSLTEPPKTLPAFLYQ